MDNHRNFGLDLFRTSAIVLLLLANAIFFFQMQMPIVMQFVPIMGFVGLEIFFVLCGFWLGTSLWKINHHSDFGIQVAFNFVKRRMIRILPLYFIILCANLVLASVMDYGVKDMWKYFLFIQNFSKPIPNFFPESWGLPVIIFATIVFPIVLWAFSNVVHLKYKKFVFPFVALGLLCVFVWTKWLYNEHTTNTTIEQWESALKTVTIYRMDSVFIGVLMGWILQNKNAFVTKSRWLFAALGMIGILFIAVGVGYFQILIENYKTFWNVFYLPLTSLSIALFLPLLVSWQSMPKFVQSPISAFAKLSYSIYLIHFSIVLLLMEHFLNINLDSDGQLVLIAFGYVALTILLGFLLWYFIEKPLTKLMR